MPGAPPGGVGPGANGGRTGPAPDHDQGPGAGDIPPLVLRCRTPYLLLVGGGAAVFLALGTGSLASGGAEGPIFAVVLFAAGALCTHFFLRYCLAALELSDHGFRIRGPLFCTDEVGWREVGAWRRWPAPPGPGFLRVAPRAGARVTIPLLYEDAHLLELGLQQGSFPVW